MADWLPSLNALRAFESLSRHLSYRKAAEELSVSPAAVKQLVKKLELTIGQPLVQRRGRGLVLTSVGSAATRDLSTAFLQIGSAVAVMRKPAPRPLVVTSDPSFAALWLVPRLDALKRLDPSLEVLLDASARLADLERGAADLAIRFATSRDPKLLTYRLFDEELGAYCSPALATQDGGLRRVEDLERLPLLRWDLSACPWAATTARWNSWRHWLMQVGAAGVRPGPGLRFTDYNLALQAAIAGQGVILGSKPILGRLVEAGLLVSPLQETAVTDIGYDLVMTKAAETRAEVAHFKTWILKARLGQDLTSLLPDN